MLTTRRAFMDTRSKIRNARVADHWENSKFYARASRHIVTETVRDVRGQGLLSSLVLGLMWVIVIASPILLIWGLVDEYVYGIEPPMLGSIIRAHPLAVGLPTGLFAALLFFATVRQGRERIQYAWGTIVVWCYEHLYKRIA